MEKQRTNTYEKYLYTTDQRSQQMNQHVTGTFVALAYSMQIFYLRKVLLHNYLLDIAPCILAARHYVRGTYCPSHLG